MKKFSYSVGFTLIELLVVIAILGILAGGVLVAIDPLEQLARGRDAGRKTAVDQLGKAVQAYYTVQSATYPPAVENAWMDPVQTSGELKALPTNPDGGGGYETGCGTSGTEQRGYCYRTDDIDTIIYARAESKSSKATAGCTGTQQVWIVWSSLEGKTGLACTEGINTDPNINVTDLK